MVLISFAVACGTSELIQLRFDAEAILFRARWSVAGAFASEDALAFNDRFEFVGTAVLVAAYQRTVELFVRALAGGDAAGEGVTLGSNQARLWAFESWRADRRFLAAAKRTTVRSEVIAQRTVKWTSER